MCEKKWHNNAYIIIIAVILVCLLIMPSVLLGLKTNKSLPITLKIISDHSTEEIQPWYDDKGKWYFFIPSYASAQNTILFSREKNSYLENTLLSTEQTLDNFEIGREYQFKQYTFFSDWNTTVVFLKSNNVPTMYISTNNRNMNRVYGDKEYKQLVKIRLFDEFGSVDYEDRGNDKIKGHGNSTWSRDKKPFQLILSEGSRLLGMNSATKWILLANGFDETNLRNKLIFDFASRVNMEWTPHSEYVDLYLNGEYNGLYLLSEKIEVDNNRLVLNDLEQDFLFERTGGDKIQFNDVLFDVNNKQYYKINYPKDCSKGKISEIQKRVSQLDAEITTENINSIDLDSWVKRFLIDEIFVNQDAICFSSFYHYDAASEKFFAGPIWDYDLSCGNDTSSWTMETQGKECIWGIKTYWYSQLYQNEIFYNRVKKVFQEEFVPELKKLVAENIPYLTEKICDSSSCNSIRWDEMFQYTFSTQAKHIDLTERLDELSAFLNERTSYLEKIWGSDKDYRVVRWYAADKTSLLDITLVESGSTITDYPIKDGKDNQDWRNCEDDTVFGSSQFVMTNIDLYSSTRAVPVAVQPTEKNGLKEWLVTNKYLVLFAMLCAVFASVGIALACIDAKRNKKGGTDGRN